MFILMGTFLPDIRLVAFLAACGAAAFVVFRYLKARGARAQAFRDAAARMCMEYVVEKTSLKNGLSGEELKQAGWIWTELEIGALWMENCIRGSTKDFNVALFDSFPNGQSGGTTTYEMMFFLKSASLPVFAVYPASLGNRLASSSMSSVRAADGFKDLVVRSSDPGPAETFLTQPLLEQLNTSDVVKRWNINVAGTCVVFRRNDLREQRADELADEYAKVSEMARWLISSAATAR